MSEITGADFQEFTVTLVPAPNRILSTPELLTQQHDTSEKHKPTQLLKTHHEAK